MNDYPFFSLLSILLIQYIVGIKHKLSNIYIDNVLLGWHAGMPSLFVPLSILVQAAEIW